MPRAADDNPFRAPSSSDEPAWPSFDDAYRVLRVAGDSRQVVSHYLTAWGSLAAGATLAVVWFR